MTDRTNDASVSVARAPKSEQTRTLILETALRLFQERGYDRTTMRAIAKEAGVSVGNAYYYFASKDHLVQGFYDRIGAEHRAAVQPLLERETELGARLSGVLNAWLDVAEPYHEFAAQFFKNAADPESPLSPFSVESEPAREAAVAIHREVLAGSRTKVPAELRDTLPEMMWLAQMGMVLAWIFDRSEGHERARRLADQGARITAKGIVLARFKVLRTLVADVHELLTDLLPGMAQSAADRRATADAVAARKKSVRRRTAAKAAKAAEAGEAEAGEAAASPGSGHGTDRRGEGAGGRPAGPGASG